MSANPHLHRCEPAGQCERDFADCELQIAGGARPGRFPNRQPVATLKQIVKRLIV